METVLCSLIRHVSISLFLSIQYNSLLINGKDHLQITSFHNVEPLSSYDKSALKHPIYSGSGKRFAEDKITSHPSSKPLDIPTLQNKPIIFSQPTIENINPIDNPINAPSQQPHDNISPTSIFTIQPKNQPTIENKNTTNNPSNEPSQQPNNQPDTFPISIPTTIPSVEVLAIGDFKVNRPTDTPHIESENKPPKADDKPPKAVNKPTDTPYIESDDKPPKSDDKPLLTPVSRPTVTPHIESDEKPLLTPVNRPTDTPYIESDDKPSIPVNRPTVNPHIRSPTNDIDKPTIDNSFSASPINLLIPSLFPISTSIPSIANIADDNSAKPISRPPTIIIVQIPTKPNNNTLLNPTILKTNKPTLSKSNTTLGKITFQPSFNPSKLPTLYPTYEAAVYYNFSVIQVMRGIAYEEFLANVNYSLILKEAIVACMIDVRSDDIKNLKVSYKEFTRHFVLAEESLSSLFIEYTVSVKTTHTSDELQSQLVLSNNNGNFIRNFEQSANKYKFDNFQNISTLAITIISPTPKQYPTLTPTDSITDNVGTTTDLRLKNSVMLSGIIIMSIFGAICCCGILYYIISRGKTEISETRSTDDDDDELVVDSFASSI